jgi:hypothetical protein
MLLIFKIVLLVLFKDFKNIIYLFKDMLKIYLNIILIIKLLKEHGWNLYKLIEKLIYIFNCK